LSLGFISTEDTTLSLNSKNHPLDYN